MADSEGWVVDARSCCADENCVNLRSDAVRVDVRCVASDASGASVLEGYFSVERHGTLPDDPREACGDAFKEGAIEPEGVGFVDAPNGLNLGVAQPLNSCAGMDRVGVEAGNHDTLDA